jgi:hypothetical protein
MECMEALWRLYGGTKGQLGVFLTCYEGAEVGPNVLALPSGLADEERELSLAGCMEAVWWH